MRKGLLGAVGMAVGVAATCAVSAVGEARADDVEELGDRGLGERCTHDCQCESRECKGFKCVVRDYGKHPLLDKGAACSFDGDCRSCDCAGGTCR